jgi:thiamine-phosphate pyrophosphorylase
MIQPSLLSLYLVANPDHAQGDLVEVVEEAIHGGVSMVQLRAKSLSDREHLALATRIRRLCAPHGLPFVVNDRVDIALAGEADGVHLGVDDLPVAVARQLGGPDFIVGYSPETENQLLQSAEQGADYLGVGPVYGTSTKADAGRALGIEEFAQRCRTSPLPVVGIGGIDTSNAASVMAAGARGVAVVSAILGAPDARKAARELRDQVRTSVR